MHSHTPSKLTKNQNLVLATLVDAEGPLSAYTILDQLRDKGFRAPLQVYRALEKLMEIGIVHRLETLNAFVACQHPTCEEQETAVFTICEICNAVVELSDNTLEKQLVDIAEQQKFLLNKSTIELRGTCNACR